MYISLSPSAMFHRGRTAEGNEPMRLLNTIFTDLFSSPDAIVLGYHFGNDRSRLLSSYPALECFKKIDNLCDLRDLAKSSMSMRQRKGRNRSVSLGGVSLIRFFLALDFLLT